MFGILVRDESLRITVTDFILKLWLENGYRDHRVELGVCFRDYG